MANGIRSNDVSGINAGNLRPNQGSTKDVSFRNKKVVKMECSLLVTSENDKKILSLKGFLFIFKR